MLIPMFYKALKEAEIQDAQYNALQNVGRLTQMGFGVQTQQEPQRSASVRTQQPVAFGNHPLTQLQGHHKDQQTAHFPTHGRPQHAFPPTQMGQQRLNHGQLNYPAMRQYYGQYPVQRTNPQQKVLRCQGRPAAPVTSRLQEQQRMMAQLRQQQSVIPELNFQNSIRLREQMDQTEPHTYQWTAADFIQHRRN